MSLQIQTPAKSTENSRPLGQDSRSLDADTDEHMPPFLSPGPSSPRAHAPPTTPAAVARPAAAQTSSIVNQGRKLCIGDRIKLFATSPYTQTGGYVGYLAQPLGSHGVCVSIPPHARDAGRFVVQTFTVLSPSPEVNARAQQGMREPVAYGACIVLVDEDGHVWNNKTGGLTGYIGPRARGQKGEMHVSLDAPGKGREQVCVGDRVEIDVEDTHRRSKTYNKRLTVFKPRKGFFGGFLGEKKPKDALLASPAPAARPVDAGDEDADHAGAGAAVEPIRAEGKRSSFMSFFSRKPAEEDDADAHTGGFLVCDGRGETLSFIIHEAQQHSGNCRYPQLACDVGVCGNALRYDPASGLSPPDAPAGQWDPVSVSRDRTDSCASTSSTYNGSAVSPASPAMHPQTPARTHTTDSTAPGLSLSPTAPAVSVAAAGNRSLPHTPAARRRSEAAPQPEADAADVIPPLLQSIPSPLAARTPGRSFARSSGDGAGAGYDGGAEGDSDSRTRAHSLAMDATAGALAVPPSPAPLRKVASTTSLAALPRDPSPSSARGSFSRDGAAEEAPGSPRELDEASQPDAEVRVSKRSQAKMMIKNMFSKTKQRLFTHHDKDEAEKAQAGPVSLPPPSAQPSADIPTAAVATVATVPVAAAPAVYATAPVPVLDAPSAPPATRSQSLSKSESVSKSEGSGSAPTSPLKARSVSVASVCGSQTAIHEEYFSEEAPAEDATDEHAGVLHSTVPSTTHSVVPRASPRTPARLAHTLFTVASVPVTAADASLVLLILVALLAPTSALLPLLLLAHVAAHLAAKRAALTPVDAEEPAAVTVPPPLTLATRPTVVAVPAPHTTLSAAPSLAASASTDLDSPYVARELPAGMQMGIDANVHAGQPGSLTPPADMKCVIPPALSAFVHGIDPLLCLTPAQTFQLLSSRWHHARNPSLAVKPVPLNEDGYNDPELMSNGRVDPIYRIPDIAELDALRARMPPPEVLSSLLPYEQACKKPHFDELLARVCVDMPHRMVESEDGDEVLGRQRWYECVRWRQENHIDTLLMTPYPLFEQVRVLCGHYFHKHDRFGHFIYIDRPGKMKMKELRKLGVDDNAMQRHFLHNCEYQWAALDSTPSAKVLSILDMSGLGFMDMMGGSTMAFVKRISKILQQHYPVRSFKIVVVNAPSWFNSLWKMISPMLHERTRAKTIVCGSDVAQMRETLLPLIDPANLPVEYGGTCQCVGGCTNNELERGYWDFVRMVNQQKR